MLADKFSQIKEPGAQVPWKLIAAIGQIGFERAPELAILMHGCCKSREGAWAGVVVCGAQPAGNSGHQLVFDVVRRLDCSGGRAIGALCLCRCTHLVLSLCEGRVRRTKAGA